MIGCLMADHDHIGFTNSLTGSEKEVYKGTLMSKHASAIQKKMHFRLLKYFMWVTNTLAARHRVGTRDLVWNKQRLGFFLFFFLSGGGGPFFPSNHNSV